MSGVPVCRQKRAPIRPLGYLKEQILENEGTNNASWLPVITKIGKEGTNTASWLPERTNVGKKGHQ
jgi:hypothetical protein